VAIFVGTHPGWITSHVANTTAFPFQDYFSQSGKFKNPSVFGEFTGAPSKFDSAVNKRIDSLAL
jgi:hypothetical protein